MIEQKLPYRKVKFLKDIIDVEKSHNKVTYHARKGQHGVISSSYSEKGRWARLDGQTVWFGVYTDEYDLLEESNGGR